MGRKRISYKPGDIIVIEHQGRLCRGVVKTADAKVFQRVDYQLNDARGTVTEVRGPIEISISLTLKAWNDISTNADLKSSDPPAAPSATSG